MNDDARDAPPLVPSSEPGVPSAAGRQGHGLGMPEPEPKPERESKPEPEPERERRSGVAGDDSGLLVSTPGGSASPLPDSRATVRTRPLGWRACVRAGLAQARRQRRLVLLVWALFFAIAWIAALPAWRWWDDALSLAPEGDRLLDGLNLALVHELLQYDRSATAAIALGSIWTLVFVALIVNPFVAGGVLGVLLDEEADEASRRTRIASDSVSDLPIPRPSVPTDAPTGLRVPGQPGTPGSWREGTVTSGLTRRFVDHAMHFYWRFSRVLLIAGAVGAIVTALWLLVLTGVADELDERGWERTRLWVRDFRILSVGVAFVVTSLVIDLARIRIARDDGSRAWASVMGAIAFLRRHAGAMLGVTGTFLVLLIAAALIYVALASAVTPRSWPLILLAMLWQQVFACVRTWLRVATLATETALVAARSAPRPAPAARHAGDLVDAPGSGDAAVRSVV